MKFSLILGTVGRTEPLRLLFHSLREQSYPRFQLIIVDQNEDSRVEEILNEFSGSFEAIHVRSPRGLSRARNVGLLYATGDLVAFPDDDCWYPRDLLERVADAFVRQPDLGGITGSSTAGNWDQNPTRVTIANAWRRGVSFSIFLRKRAIEGLRFDETLGVGAGTPWGAGEETDFLLQILERGVRIEYDPTICVNHPEWTFRSIGPAKGRSYARGTGRILRKHRFPMPQVLYHIVRPLLASLAALVRGNLEKAVYHFECFAGRIEGWIGRKLSLAAARP